MTVSVSQYKEVLCNLVPMVLKKTRLQLAHDKKADSGSVIIPYMAANIRYITLYDIITRPISA